MQRSGLDALVVERGDGAGDGGDLRIDVDGRVGEPFLLALLALNVTALRRSSCSAVARSWPTCSPVRSAWRARAGWAESARSGRSRRRTR